MYTSGFLQATERETWTANWLKNNRPATICLAYKMYWDNYGAEFVEVAKQRLVYLRNHARKGCTFSALPGWAGTRDWIAWTPKVEPNVINQQIDNR